MGKYHLQIWVLTLALFVMLASSVKGASQQGSMSIDEVVFGYAYFTKFCVDGGPAYDTALVQETGVLLSEADARAHYPMEEGDIFSIYLIKGSQLVAGIVNHDDGGVNCFVKFEATSTEQVQLMFEAMFASYHPKSDGSELEADGYGSYFFANDKFPRLVQVRFDDKFATLYAYMQ